MIKWLVVVIVLIDVLALAYWIYSRKEEDQDEEPSEEVVLVTQELSSLRRRVKELEHYVSVLENENENLRSQTFENAMPHSSVESAGGPIEGSLNEEIEYLGSRRKSPKEIAKAVGKGIDEIRLIQYVQERQKQSANA